MGVKTVALLLALACVLMSAAAQLVMKLGLSDPSTSAETTAGIYLNAIRNPWVLGGLCLYGVSAVVWLWVLAKLDVSVAYPMVSLGFVITMLAGVFWLGEPWSWTRVAGAGLIVAGVFLFATDV
jgi:multidrug transporter EmrE-like cation transporter